MRWTQDGQAREVRTDTPTQTVRRADRHAGRGGPRAAGAAAHARGRLSQPDRRAPCHERRSAPGHGCPGVPAPRGWRGPATRCGRSSASATRSSSSSRTRSSCSPSSRRCSGRTAPRWARRPGIPFAQYFLPGMLATGIMLSSFQHLAISIAVERDDGGLKRLHGTPLPSSAFFLGKTGEVLVTSRGPDRAAPGGGRAAVRGPDADDGDGLGDVRVGVRAGDRRRHAAAGSRSRRSRARGSPRARS